MNLKLFNVSPSIPDKLKFLEKLSYNMWWCWHPLATELFLRIDPNLWRELRGNSRKMLNSVPQARLEELAQDPGYLRKPDAAFVKRLNAICPIKKVSLAPELEGSEDCIRECSFIDIHIP